MNKMYQKSTNKDTYNCQKLCYYCKRQKKKCHKIVKYARYTLQHNNKMKGANSDEEILHKNNGLCPWSQYDDQQLGTGST